MSGTSLLHTNHISDPLVNEKRNRLTVGFTLSFKVGVAVAVDVVGVIPKPFGKPIIPFWSTSGTLAFIDDPGSESRR